MACLAVGVPCHPRGSLCPGRKGTHGCQGSPTDGKGSPERSTLNGRTRKESCQENRELTDCSYGDWSRAEAPLQEKRRHRGVPQQPAVAVDSSRRGPWGAETNSRTDVQSRVHGVRRQRAHQRPARPGPVPGGTKTVAAALTPGGLPHRGRLAQAGSGGTRRVTNSDCGLRKPEGAPPVCRGPARGIDRGSGAAYGPLPGGTWEGRPGDRS